VTTAADLNAAITAAFGVGISGSSATGKEVITGGGTGAFTVTQGGTADTGVTGTVSATTAYVAATSNSNTVYVGDGTSTAAANTTIGTSISTVSSAALNLSETSLSNSTARRVL
jgi:hypothetical protein